MLCNKCKKNEANIFYTEIVGGEKTEMHICEDCAFDYSSSFQTKNVTNSELTLGNLLSTVLGSYYTNENSTQKKETKNVVCNTCGLSYNEFLKIGRFGCMECYDTFSSTFNKSLSNIQGSNIHVGKKPKGYISKTQKLIDELSEVEKLSLKLQDAVEKEEFEEAVKLRDQIRLLKEENNA